jgi:low affinity Fe/Cu permease
LYRQRRIPCLRAAFVHDARQRLGVCWSCACHCPLALTGPTFHFSDTWQLIINTATTVITFLMVFLIQNTQNRDAKAVHLKLDELIRAIKDACNELVDLEDLSDEELESSRNNFGGCVHELRMTKQVLHVTTSRLKALRAHFKQSGPRALTRRSRAWMRSWVPRLRFK